MAQYIDLDSLIVMFKSTYANSYLRGGEIAKILEVRFGKQESSKQTTNATSYENSGLDED